MDLGGVGGERKHIPTVAARDVDSVCLRHLRALSRAKYARRSGHGSDQSAGAAEMAC